MWTGTSINFESDMEVDCTASKIVWIKWAEPTASECKLLLK